MAGVPNEYHVIVMPRATFLKYLKEYTEAEHSLIWEFSGDITREAKELKEKIEAICKRNDIPEEEYAPWFEDWNELEEYE